MLCTLSRAARETPGARPSHSDEPRHKPESNGLDLRHAPLIGMTS